MASYFRTLAPMGHPSPEDLAIIQAAPEQPVSGETEKLAAAMARAVNAMVAIPQSPRLEVRIHTHDDHSNELQWQVHQVFENSVVMDSAVSPDQLYRNFRLLHRLTGIAAKFRQCAMVMSLKSHMLKGCPRLSPGELVPMIVMDDLPMRHPALILNSLSQKAVMTPCGNDKPWMPDQESTITLDLPIAHSLAPSLGGRKLADIITIEPEKLAAQPPAAAAAWPTLTVRHAHVGDDWLGRESLILYLEPTPQVYFWTTKEEEEYFGARLDPTNRHVRNLLAAGEIE